MSSFFKKALGIFVEFENQPDKGANPSFIPEFSMDVARNPSTHEEAKKFENYFNNLFDKSNLPGPDYFEFYKMMETLEAHIPDYKARIAATFASLSIQGLTKEKLLDTANKYKEIVNQDRLNFERVLNEKSNVEISQRKNQITALEKKIRTNSDEIQRLTKEISDAQIQMSNIKTEVSDQEGRLNKNKNGYLLASQAVISKINSDIQKIQSSF